MDRADAVRAGPFVLIVREAHGIIILHALPCPFGGIFGVGIIVSKTGGTVDVDILRRFAFDDPLGHELAHAARAAIAIQGHACRHPQAARAGDGSQHGLAVGGVGAGVAGQVDDAGILQERNAADGPFEQHLEALIIAGQGAVTVLPRHAVDPARDRIGLVAADDQPALFLSHIHQVIRIAQAGRVLRKLVSHHGLDGDVLVIDRRGRQIDSCHGGDARGPHPGRVDHDVGFDRASIGDDSLDLTFWRKLEAGDARVGVDLHTHLTDDARHSGGRVVGGEMSIARQVDRAVQVLVADLRHDLDRFGRRDDFHIHTDRLRPADTALQLLELFLAGCDTQAADVVEQSQLAVQLDGIFAELHHSFGCGELGHHARRVGRFPAGDLPFFEQDDLLPAHLR